MVKKSIKIIIFVVVLTLLIAWSVDYFMVKAKKEPIFCLQTVIYDAANGSTKECIGLGYKIYEYDLETLKTTEFGIFLMDRKTK